LDNLLLEVTDSESEDDEFNAKYYYNEGPDQAAEPMILDDEDDIAIDNEEANEQLAPEGIMDENLLPYQETIFYVNALNNFEEQFEQWANDQYEQRRIVFERTQQELYNDAMLLDVYEQGEQEELHDVNLPFDNPLPEEIEEQEVEGGGGEEMEQEVLVQRQANPVLPADCRVMPNDDGSDGDNDTDAEEDEIEEEDDELEEEENEEEMERINLLNYAMNLPVEATARDGHREHRNLPGQVVKLHEIKQFTSEARALACLYATYLMGWNQERSKKEKLIIADAATTLVAYDLGYKRRIGKYGLEEWLKKIEASVLNTSANGIFHSKHKGMESQTKRVEAEHPTYLHSLYRRATMILGDAATFTEIASQMNLLSAVDERPTMNLNKWSLLRWFKTKKGKGKRTVFRPLLTPQHKINRVQHAHRIRTLMDQGAAICYLDEKWFYLVSRRKTSKYLPRAEFEAEGADRIRVRRVISRSYPLTGPGSIWTTTSTG